MGLQGSQKPRVMKTEHSPSRDVVTHCRVPSLQLLELEADGIRLHDPAKPQMVVQVPELPLCVQVGCCGLLKFALENVHICELLQCTRRAPSPVRHRCALAAVSARVFGRGPEHGLGVRGGSLGLLLRKLQEQRLEVGRKRLNEVAYTALEIVRGHRRVNLCVRRAGR